PTSEIKVPSPKTPANRTFLRRGPLNVVWGPKAWTRERRPYEPAFDRFGSFVKLEEVVQGGLFCEHLDAVLVGFFFVGVEGLEPAFFAVHVSAFYASGHGF